jgi:hypothetical protein
VRAGEKERRAVSEGRYLHLGSGDVASKDWINVNSQRGPEIDIGGKILDRPPRAGYSIHMDVYFWSSLAIHVDPIL